MDSECDSTEFGVYVPLAERLARIESKTPDRFKRNPVLRESNHDKWKRRAKTLTKPQGPRFATDTRSTRLRAARADANKKPEREEKRKVAGAPNLTTARRAAYHEAPQPETFDRNFKARPVPSANRTRPMTSRSSSIVSQTTRQEPFSFDKRAPRKKQVVEEKPVVKRHHEPGALPSSIDKPGALPERQTKTTTTTAPFNFATANRNLTKSSFAEPEFQFGPKKHSNQKFMKKALDGHLPIMPAGKSATVPKTPTLSSTSRANKRREFDEEMKQKREEEEEQKKADEEAKREMEKEEDNAVRATLIHRANPIRTNFKPVPERQQIPTTLPITPKYAGPRTRSRNTRSRK